MSTIEGKRIGRGGKFAKERTIPMISRVEVSMRGGNSSAVANNADPGQGPANAGGIEGGEETGLKKKGKKPP
jgi:hypothetical protein